VNIPEQEKVIAHDIPSGQGTSLCEEGGQVLQLLDLREQSLGLGIDLWSLTAHQVLLGHHALQVCVNILQQSGTQAVGSRVETSQQRKGRRWLTTLWPHLDRLLGKKTTVQLLPKSVSPRSLLYLKV
jgi:hypothetical protein